MDELDIMLLSEEQVFDKEKKLKIFNNYSLRAEITDFAILLGGEPFKLTKDGNTKNIGFWSLSSSDEEGDILCVDEFEEEEAYFARCRKFGIRPVMSYTNLDDFSKNVTTNQEGILEIKFGEYPQAVACNDLQNALDYLFNRKALVKTGKIYTTDSVADEEFYPFEHIEYEYNGRKYVRVKANLCDDTEVLNNGSCVNLNDYVWVEVSPITWLVDEELKLLISKNLIAAGVRFCDNGSYNDYFEGTEIYTFLNKYFAKEIIQSDIQELTDEDKKKIEQNTNPYNFNLEKVSEETIIRGMIESNVAVFLHGKSSDGKSARVLEIDRDATIIYLANENPDTINGKSVYNEKNNEMIDIKPSWLVKLEEKCKDGKLHILFFDEITNAFPRVQGIVFNIILNKEVNGKWKLPENARIVAAGNEMEDSLSANELSEPLFNRFAHVYIKTTTESWLKWASTHNIHPAIYSFIAYKNGTVLRSKYDGKKVNADPRKWEMASTVLYKTGSPEMLRALIGESITNEFVAFCSSRVITLEDVLNDNYSIEDIEGLNTAERYATVMGLSIVDEENIRKVREFVKKINAELLKVFDNLWANTEDRLEILSEIKLTEKDKTKTL